MAVGTPDEVIAEYTSFLAVDESAVVLEDV
jgi:hypothetical protein